MIFTNSRYYNGPVYQENGNIYVFRKFPGTLTSNIVAYIWKDGDRLDTVAQKLLGDANKWWVIMDYNPNLIECINIKPGTAIKVPYV